MVLHDNLALTIYTQRKWAALASNFNAPLMLLGTKIFSFMESTHAHLRVVQPFPHLFYPVI